MGLDTVEYVFHVEDLFGVRLPDAELREARTPRDLARVIQRSLPYKPSRPGCLSQRAFYRLRNAILEMHPELTRAEIRPDVEFHSRGWLGLRRETLGSLADRIVAEQPSTLRGPDEGWTDAQIVEILLRVVEQDQGLEPHRHNGDSEFVRDMRMD